MSEVEQGHEVVVLEPKEPEVQGASEFSSLEPVTQRERRKAEITGEKLKLIQIEEVRPLRMHLVKDAAENEFYQITIPDHRLLEAAHHEHPIEGFEHADGEMTFEGVRVRTAGE